MDDKTLFKYLILQTTKGIGTSTAQKLISHFGGMEELFHVIDKKKNIEGIPSALFTKLKDKSQYKLIEKEINFIRKNNIQPLGLFEQNYPKKLNFCSDAPLILYKKGQKSLQTSKMLSIVGTRKMTHYGEVKVKEIVGELCEKYSDITIISGLAFGIDITAHKTALEYNVNNISVLPTSLKKIYPASHQKIAEKIAENGCLISETTSFDTLSQVHFVRRNRIIAGLSDAVLVVESGIKGGAMITARYASNYNRDVFTVPGRTSDNTFLGCHYLIKNHMAAMVESADDIEKNMNWDISKENNAQIVSKPKTLFVTLSADDKKVLNVIKMQSKTIDIIALESNMPISKVSILLLNLEFNGLVYCSPGNVYSIS